MSTYVSTPGGKTMPNRRYSRQSSREKTDESETPKTKPVQKGSEFESGTCDICKVPFTDPNSKILKCQRCSKHFCIACLNKPATEYKALKKSDSMWFCMECKVIVEKSIVTDLKIEERCKEIMVAHEARITSLEEKMMKTCDEKKIRDIIQSEILKLKETKNSCKKDQVKEIIHTEISKAKETETEKFKDIIQEEIQKVKQKELVTVASTDNELPHLHEAVIEELNNRKSREKIYGLEEKHIKNTQKRAETEYKTAVPVLQECGVEIGPRTVRLVSRMGKYIEAETANTEECKSKNKNQTENTAASEGIDVSTPIVDGERERAKKARPRPMLIVLDDQELIPKIFKNVSKLKDGPYSEIQVANDLSVEEQNREKERFRVRGPPWARRVVRILKKD